MGVYQRPGAIEMVRGRRIPPLTPKATSALSIGRLDHMTKDRFTVKFLGRKIGTAEDWDGDPGEAIWFYNFIPSIKALHPCATFMIDEAHGNFIAEDKDGNTLGTWDIIDTLRTVRKDHTQRLASRTPKGA